MCGISGIISNNPNEVTTERLKEMSDIIHYRGPDGEGHWINSGKNVGLGHRRLSIIDLSHEADQPMHYLGRYSIVFNGEIYNYIELRKILSAQGYHFTSISDTEVLMALYDRDKENCLHFLDGMFSFVIYDDKKKEIFAARDRFGEKPFYYSYKQGHYFLFSSEMKSLWAAGVPKKVNDQMLFIFLAHGDLQNPQKKSETFYDNCLTLPHSHYLTLSVTDISLSIKKYYDIDYKNIDHTITEEKAEEKFRELFYIAVSRRLRSDVAVGSSLSGGLDSTLVVCIIDELKKGSNHTQNTFSAVFPGFAKDERKYIEYAIANLNVFPHFTTPGHDGMINEFEELFRHQEEPFGSASIYAQYCVMRLARENNVTVLLDGQGADEYLAGYHPYYTPFFNDLKVSYPSRYRSEYNQYLHLHKDNHINPRMKKDLKYFVRSRMPKIIKPVKNLVGYYKQKSSPFFAHEFYEANHKNYLAPEYYFKDLNGALHQSMLQGSLQTLLRYADRNSMAHGREVRLPFLFHELVEFVFSLPPYFKIRDGWTKWILRKAFKNVLPQKICWRTDKVGFEPPQNEWLKSKGIAEKIYDSKKKLLTEGIINEKFANTELLPADTWRVLMAGYLINQR